MSFPRKILHPLNPHHLLSAAAPSNLASLRRRHAVVITSGDSANPFLAAKLISLYASFRRPDLSTLTFNSLPAVSLDAFLWNSIIKAHFSNADYPLALRLYSQMPTFGSLPNHFTIPMVASACAETSCVRVGSCIHGTSYKLGLLCQPGVGSSLVYMYSKCGVLEDAVTVFDEMPVRDVVAWTALIVGCVRNGEAELGLECLSQMHRDGGERPNSRTVEGGLQACASLGVLREGMCIHGFSVKSGFVDCGSIKSSLLSFYSKCESLGEVVLAFNELAEKDIVAWTSVVGVYARKGHVGKCLEMFQAMMGSGVEPDGVFISCMLMGFGNSASVHGGKVFHGILLRRKFELSAVVINSLLSMYCKFEKLAAAEGVFGMPGERDVVAWNLMISGYGKLGLDIKCLDLFTTMQFLGFGLDFDRNCLVSVVSSCTKLGALRSGQSVHCCAIKSTSDCDTSVSNALVGMYGKCGGLDIARRLFDQITRDVVSWNVMIAGYTQHGHSDDALLLFDQMLLEEVRPNSATLNGVLSACSHMAALNRGRWIHDYIKEKGLECDISLCTALIDMYAKCGQLETSRLLFDSMPERDVVSWNVMISGYGIHGSAKEALEVFEAMLGTGATPNDVTFLALLSACSHSGLVKEGKNLFVRMRKYYVLPTRKHYACMVDLLGRSGNLDEAERLILTMPMKPDGAIWGALLGACKMHNNVGMGERIASRAFELDPENDGYYILMSNMYGCASRWEDVEMLRMSMKHKGMEKRAGWSAVELADRVHVFSVGDEFQNESEKVYAMLEAIYRQMEE